MSTNPPPTQGQPVSPQQVWNDLHDPELWKRREVQGRVLSVLVPLARQELHQWARFCRQQDSLAAEGALWSAGTSFFRHLLDGEYEDAASLEELAAQLLRIAVNRMQRRRYRDRQVQEAVGRATCRDREGQMIPFDPPANVATPGEEAEQAELREQIEEVIQDVLGKGPPQSDGKRVIHAYVLALSEQRGAPDEKVSQAEIARSLGFSQAKVSRYLTDFRNRLRQRFNDA
jgi:DNA-directed RNA polymerase specialized sigma24 family protein